MKTERVIVRVTSNLQVEKLHIDHFLTTFFVNRNTLKVA